MSLFGCPNEKLSFVIDSVGHFLAQFLMLQRLG